MATRASIFAAMRCSGKPSRIGGRGTSIQSKPSAGQDDTEDLFKPGMFVATITKPTTVTLVAAMNDIRDFNWDADLNRRRVGFSPHVPKSQTLQRLHHAANDFIVVRDDAPTARPARR